MSLWTITEEMTRVQDAFLSLCNAPMDGDDAEAATAAMQHIDALAEAFDAKADDYAALIRSVEHRANGREEEARRIAELARSDRALAERLRSALMEAMQRTNRRRFDTERFALSVQQNGGKRALRIMSEDEIPEEYRVPVYSTRIDRDGIREAIERGEAVPGAVLEDRGFRLNIK